MNKVCVSLLLLLFAGPILLSGIDLTPGVPTSYTLGICSLSGVGVERENLFFLHNLPGLFLDTLHGITEHHYAAEERNALDVYLRKEAEMTLREAVGELILQRDELFFTGGSEQRRETLTDSIGKKRAELEELSAGTYESPAIGVSVPLKPIKENLSGELLPPPGPFVRTYCEKKNIDILVYGSLEQVEDYFYLLVNVYNRYSDSVFFHERTACDGRELSARAAGIADRLKGVILGREWAGFRIAVDPPGASILIDGVFSGVGVVHNNLFLPGTFSVEGRAPGFAPEKVSMVLPPGTETEVTIVLQELERAVFRVESDPPGADVYVASIWVGKTPVEVTWPGNPVKLAVKKEGYRDQVNLLSEFPSSFLRFSLQPEPGVLFNSREDFRNRFYRDFSSFILSLPFSFAGYAVAEHYSIALNEATQGTTVAQEEQYRLWRLARVCYNLYTAGLFANTFLFVNMLVSAAEYLGQTGTAAGVGR